MHTQLAAHTICWFFTS